MNEVVDVIREESDEDAYAAVGLDDDQDIFGSVWDAAKSRWLWLGVNLCTAFFASRVIAAFDGTIERVVALAALMPVVASMAGNSGNQTLTLLVRSMAMGQVTEANQTDLIKKELIVSVINGLLGGVVAGLFVWLLYFDSSQGLLLGGRDGARDAAQHHRRGVRGVGRAADPQIFPSGSGDGWIGTSYLYDRFRGLLDFSGTCLFVFPLANGIHLLRIASKDTFCRTRRRALR